MSNSPLKQRLIDEIVKYTAENGTYELSCLIAEAAAQIAQRSDCVEIYRNTDDVMLDLINDLKTV